MGHENTTLDHPVMIERAPEQGDVPGGTLTAACFRYVWMSAAVRWPAKDVRLLMRLALWHLRPLLRMRSARRPARQGRELAPAPQAPPAG